MRKKLGGSGIMDSLMIDMESLGVSSDSIILSAGVCLFDEGGPEDDRYLHFDINHQIVDGRTIRKSTVDWWRKENPGEFNTLVTEGTQYLSSLQHLIEGHIAAGVKNIWSRGHFDFGVLESLGIPNLKYWMHRDCRTLDAFQRPKKKATHNALQDCYDQIEHVNEVMRVWKDAQDVTPRSSEEDVQCVPTAMEQSSSTLQTRTEIQGIFKSSPVQTPA